MDGWYLCGLFRLLDTSVSSIAEVSLAWTLPLLQSVRHLPHSSSEAEITDRRGGGGEGILCVQVGRY